MKDKLVTISSKLGDQVEDAETKRQISFLIDQLANKKVVPVKEDNSTSSDDGYQDDEDEDFTDDAMHDADEELDIEPKVDMNDPISATLEEFSGTQLLESEYLSEELKVDKGVEIRTGSSVSSESLTKQESNLLKFLKSQIQ